MGCCGRKSGTTQASGLVSRKRCWLCKAWCVLTRKSKTPYGDPCVTFPGHIIRKPDPCIYSQFLLMQLGKPVTWDNPDVRILMNGVEQNTYDLTADTEYDVEITVHNSSRDKPADGTSVLVQWIEFGAGSQTRHPIANLVASVPLWPGTDVVSTKWRTPAAPGHYCIEVELSHPNDGNPANNRGWNNTQVHAASSPVERPVRIFNRYPGACPPVAEGGGPYLDYRRALFGWGTLAAMAGMLYGHALPAEGSVFSRYGLAMLTGYVIGAAAGLVYYWMYNRRLRPPEGRRPTTEGRIDCHLVEIEVDSFVFEDASGKAFDPDKGFAEKAPVWPAHVDPPTFVFLPGETFRDVVFHTDAPEQAGPPGQFNVNVRQGGEPTGGVTFTITRGA
jgi:hypothetical protein